MRSLQESILDVQGIEKDLKDEFALILSILDEDNPKIDNIIDRLIEWTKKNAVKYCDPYSFEDAQHKGIYIIHTNNPARHVIVTEVIYFSGHDQQGLYIRQKGNHITVNWIDMSARLAYSFEGLQAKHDVYYLGDNSKYEKTLLDKIKQIQ